MRKDKKKLFTILITSFLSVMLIAGVFTFQNYTSHKIKTPSEKIESLVQTKTIAVRASNPDVLSEETNIIANYEDVYVISCDNVEDARKTYERYMDKVDNIADMSTSFSIETNDDKKSDNTNHASGDSLNILKEIKREDLSGYIALIDTGADADVNYSVIDNDPSDNNGHGTRMLDCIRQENENAKVVSIKVLDGAKTTAIDVYAGIKLAIESKVSIINLSLCAPDVEQNAIVKDVIKEALGKGITVVGAAGNYNTSAKKFIPACVEGVISVGAVNEDGTKEGRSNYDASLYVVASSTSEASARYSGRLSTNRTDFKVFDIPTDLANIPTVPELEDEDNPYGFEFLEQGDPLGTYNMGTVNGVNFPEESEKTYTGKIYVTYSSPGYAKIKVSDLGDSWLRSCLEADGVEELEIDCSGHYSGDTTGSGWAKAMQSGTKNYEVTYKSFVSKSGDTVTMEWNIQFSDDDEYEVEWSEVSESFEWEYSIKYSDPRQNKIAIYAAVDGVAIYDFPSVDRSILTDQYVDSMTKAIEKKLISNTVPTQWYGYTGQINYSESGSPPSVENKIPSSDSGTLTYSWQSASHTQIFKRDVKATRPRYGYVKVTKTSSLPEVTDDNDYYGKLTSSKFKIYSGDTEKGTAYGNGSSVKLVPGTYTVEETKAPTNFIKDSSSKSIKVAAGKTTTVSFENEPAMDTVDVLLFKESEDGKNEAPISEAQYTVKYYPSKTASGTPLKTWTLSTDANGKVAGPTTWDGKIPYGTITIKESKAPKGYITNQETKTIQVDGSGHFTASTAPVSIEPYQMCRITLTVYDKTTKDNNKEVPVSGIEFNIYKGDDLATIFDSNRNETGQTSFVTDENGQISTIVRATGEYTLKQVGSVENYAMTTNSNSEDYCLDIKINTLATDSEQGKNKVLDRTKTHYENRQWINIESQIQDENLKENTPAILGGDKETGAYVTTLGTNCTLYADSDNILLGYKNDGTPIKINKGELLVTKLSENGMNGDGKAYIYAGFDKNGNKKDILEGKYYIPNGKYKWVLNSVPSGYWNESGKITNIDASWLKENEQKIIVKKSVPIEIKRQKIALNLYVKTYTNEDRDKTGTMFNPLSKVFPNNDYTIFRNGSFARIKSFNEVDFSMTPAWLRFIDIDITKDVASNEHLTGGISKVSTEVATIYKKEEKLLVVKSTGIVPNAVYALINIGDIVGIESGGVIKNGTELGYYVSDSNGHIQISNFGTGQFNNPNSNVMGDLVYNEVLVRTENGKIDNGSLPNGAYGFKRLSEPDGYIPELGLQEDIVLDTKWQLNESHLSGKTANAITFLKKDKVYEPDTYKPFIAPDVPVNEDHPYKYTENPEDGIEDVYVDSGGKEWIDENSENYSYRILDLANISTDGQNKYEVSDDIPTTFGFYLKEDRISDKVSTFRYYTTFYYQIAKDEYDNAPQSAKNNGEYIYVPGRDATYARRFSYPEKFGVTSAPNAKDVIILNKNSEGYVAFDEIKPNLPIWGAAYNTDWLNEKLRDKNSYPDELFRILVKIDVEETTIIKATNKKVVKLVDTSWATLKIKNRELFELD